MYIKTFSSKKSSRSHTVRPQIESKCVITKNKRYVKLCRKMPGFEKVADLEHIDVNANAVKNGVKGLSACIRNCLSLYTMQVMA